MFTGIIEEVGTVEAVEERDGLRRIRIATEGLSENLAAGASVAVDGACLTAEHGDHRSFTAALVTSTLSRTVAAGYVVGSRVNLERAARVGDRLDGHIVQGHVDGLGTLSRLHHDGETRLLDFAIPEAVAARTVLHGSITINGVSLTVNALNGSECQVAIIPHTWTHTNLALLELGHSVNVEGDLIGKYVGRIVAPHLKGL